MAMPPDSTRRRGGFLNPPPHRRAILATFILAFLTVTVFAQDKQYQVKGMVMRVDAATRTFVVSHEKIDGLMESMIMPFDVRDAKELQGVQPGAIVEFTLTVGSSSAYASRIVVRRYQTVEKDPKAAQRLAVMKKMAGLSSPPLAVGAKVPDFTLIDQGRQRVSLASLAGKVVALNFVYTRCALPQFCLRVTNNFGALQKRFQKELGRDLVLLTVTFDPERDTPEVLAEYASQWKADPKTWHFLTGAVPDVRKVCAMFGVEFFPDEGLLNHSLRTVVLDRRGVIVASIEGNQYSPEQLGDLVSTTLK
jgi:protein SCO1